jgi:hypothetical protein
MSLFLGVYSRKAKVELEEWRDVIDDFSLHGEREIRSRRDGKILFSTFSSRTDHCSHITENERGSLIVLFSGRIYNFDSKVTKLIEMGHRFKDRQNPAEFLVHSYEEHGTSFLKRTNGNFAFGIYDKRRQELVLGNDLLGSYALFVYAGEEHCIFCSEYEPILKYRQFAKELNYDAIAEYVALGALLGDKTFFKRIINLYPGSLLRICRDSVVYEPYGQLTAQVRRGKDISYFAKKISNSVKRAVQLRVEHPETIAIPLSGGADTRLILGSLTKEQRSAMRFYTYKSPHLNEGEDKDVVVARNLAHKYGLKHTIEENSAYNFDFGVWYFDMRRRLLPVSPTRLSALFGGEFLGGYCFKIYPLNDLSRDSVTRRLKYFFDADFLRKAGHPYDSLQIELGKIHAENRELLFIMRQMSRGFFTNFYNGSRGGFLQTYQLQFRWDCVFSDIDFIRDLLEVPKEYLLDYELYLRIYRECYEELARLPFNSLIVRDSQGFLVPERNGINPRMVDSPRYAQALKYYLKSSETWKKRYYNKKSLLSACRKRLHAMEVILRGLSGEWKQYKSFKLVKLMISNRDYLPEVYCFLHFEAWYRRFMANPKDKQSHK